MKLYLEVDEDLAALVRARQLDAAVDLIEERYANEHGRIPLKTTRRPDRLTLSIEIPDDKVIFPEEKS